MSTLTGFAPAELADVTDAGRVVGELLWNAVRRWSGFDFDRAELAVSLSAARDVAAVLPHLTGTEIDEWVGESGIPYRDYVGWLPSGLRLRLTTDADVVPNLLEGGGS